jgi:lysine/ornithine N-monooxygenase
MDFDVAIVGAGPYGLSGAAYLMAKGLGVGVFGEPMSFWRDHMPAGMFLRSNWAASHISDPHNRLTLDHFKADSGARFFQPIPLEHFVAYGNWYRQKAVPELHRRQVSGLEKGEAGFRLTLDGGDIVTSRRVVIATGISPFPWMPKEFAGLPGSHVTHSSDHSDLAPFRGRDVLVVGGGQSALDAARLLHAMHSRVEVVARQEELRWVGQNAWLHKLGPVSWCLYSNYDVGPAGISRLVGFPNLFRRLPRDLQDRIGRRAIRPAGTGWQRPQLAQVPITLNCSATSAEIAGDKVQLKLSDGTERVVDHVIVATGYRVDAARYAFFSPAIRRELRTQSGYPVLGAGLESSISGLHFVGKPAGWSFGPLLNFVSGTHFTGRELARTL